MNKSQQTFIDFLHSPKNRFRSITIFAILLLRIHDSCSVHKGSVLPKKETGRGKKPPAWRKHWGKVSLSSYTKSTFGKKEIDFVNGNCIKYFYIICNILYIYKIIVTFLEQNYPANFEQESTNFYLYRY